MDQKNLSIVHIIIDKLMCSQLDELPDEMLLMFFYTNCYFDAVINIQSINWRKSRFRWVNRLHTGILLI